MTVFLEIFLKVLALLGVFIGGLWALTKFVVERGLLPASELDVECKIVGEKENKKIIEITVVINNKGSSTLVAKNISLKLKTICTGDNLSLYKDKRKFGRLQFPHSLSDDLTMHQNKEHGAFLLVPYNTFVQAGVCQKYSFVTSVSQNVEFIHAHAQFQYAQKPIFIQRGILWVSRQVGLIQYSLQHLYEPHTVQRAFNVGMNNG